MLVRTSQALILCPDNGQTLAYNFLRQTSFACNEDTLRLLHFSNEWRDTDSFKEVLAGYRDDDIRDGVEQLVDLGGLIVKGSPDEQEERDKVENWEWGIPSAMLHYCEQDRKFASRAEAEEIQRQRAQELESPDLYSLNSRHKHVVQLENPLQGNALISLMARRRTVRDVKRQEISLKSISDMLYSGLAIIGETRNCVNKLPLGMTPSGGARNPYEAFLYAPRVKGLKPGIYHYSAKEHSLGRVSEEIVPNPSMLVGDQHWINEMSAIIFLCADFTRTMWKYQDNNAYRVTLIEAGHIGQNIMLAATDHGLTACPSAALAHSEISRMLNLDHALQSPVYALMIGVPDQTSEEGGLH